MAADAGNGRRRVRALILTPTRELAAQVGESVQIYGKHLPLKTAVIFGGVSINPQIALLRRGVDILVATPGRLLDHAQQRHLDLAARRNLRARRSRSDARHGLPAGHSPRHRIVAAAQAELVVLGHVPRGHPQAREQVPRSPVSVEVGQRNATAERIEQAVYFADKGQKRGLLSWLIGSGNWRQVLVFTRTKHGANRLAEQLIQDGLSAAAIHGNKSQGARTRALADFKQGTVRVLVATDIAARGLDIDQLPHVVNYDLPEVPEHYVHRIGRTGRAGNEGLAVSLVAHDERPLLKFIERLLGSQLPVRSPEGYTPGPAAPRAAATRASSRPPRLERTRQQRWPADSSLAAMAVGTVTAAAINAAARARRAANSAATATEPPPQRPRLARRRPVSRATCSHA